MKTKMTTWIALAILLMANGLFAATIVVPTDQPTIEAAIGAASAGDVISILDGTYNPVGTLTINQELTLSGQSEAGVIINIPAGGGYGFLVTASDVTMDSFTLAANAANENYPIHASGTSNAPNGFDNLIIADVTISGSHRRTGLDIHGYNSVLISNLTSTDAYGGNGLQVTGCIDVDMDNITTLNNAWGSLAIYCSSGSYLNRASSNVTIDGNTLSLGEQNLFSQNEFGLENTNIVITGYEYLVRNMNYRPDAAGFTHFQDTFIDASAFALGLEGVAVGSYILSIADGSASVIPGLTIQAAIDGTDAGGTVAVAAGTYREQLSITKDLDLTGAGMALVTVESPDAIDRTSYITTSWTGSTKTADPVVGVVGPAEVNISGFTVDGREAGPGDFHGIHYYNASGSVAYCTVTNISYPAVPGAQNVGNLVVTTDGTSGPVITIANNVFPNFQKFGMLVMGPDVMFDISDNTVTSVFSPSIAGNGMQLAYGATGFTSDNVVTGVGYSGEDWSGTGILLMECGDIIMTGDQVSHSESGISYNNWGGWGYLSTVPVNITLDGVTMTDNTWSFYAQLSGNDSDLNLIATDCTVTGSIGDAFDVYGTDAYSGLWTGWENGDLNVSITGLTLDNTAIDGIWTADNPSSATNTVHSFNVTGSSFTNTTGAAVANTFTTEIIAEGNFWDALDGPLAGAKAGSTNKRAALVQPVGFVEMDRGGDRLNELFSSDKAAETVSGPVDYSPWYGLPLGSVPMTVGTSDDIQDAVDMANSGDTVNAVAVTFVAPAQIVIDKDLTLNGAGIASTIIEPGFNTTSGYVSTSALVYVDYGVEVIIEDLAIDGTGFMVNHAIQSRCAELIVRNCEIRDIYSALYDGRGIVFLTGTGLVENCVMSNIQRIGVHIRGAVEPTPPTVAIIGLTYTGKGVGDFLDYGIEFGGGGQGIVSTSTITNCQGVAASDGSDSAGILVSDYFGTFTVADITNSTLTGNTTGMVVGYAVDDISAVTIHGSDISGNTAAGVTTTGTVVNALGNWWGTALGPFHGTLNPLGTGNQVSDNVLFDPWSGMAGGSIIPVTTGPLNCSQSITLTFNYTADEYTPDMFLYNAVVSATSGLDFGAVVDLLPFTNDNNNFFAMESGTNVWTITGSTVGNPNHPVSGAGTTGLFTITFTATGDVVGDVVIESLTLRDPANNTIPVTLSAATITYDCTAPLAVTGITADPHHNKVEVNWNHNGSDVDHYEVFSGLWHDGAHASVYPEYDDVANTIPTRPADYAAVLANSAEWFDVGDVTALTVDQNWADALDRGVYYYEVFAVDAAGNASPAAANNDRATNYWLGDMYKNGVVAVADMGYLGAAFGTISSDGGYQADADVGPTDNWSRLGIPNTDNAIDFEDLMVFSMNFGVVSASNKSDMNISTTADLSWVRYDEGTYALRLNDASGLKGVHLRANLPEGASVTVTAGDLLDQQSEMTFLRNIGQDLDVSLAITGVDNGFTGQGDLFIVECSVELTLEDITIDLRGSDNSNIDVNLDSDAGTLTPRVFGLNAAYPNPFNPMTKISFSLPESQEVRLSVYGIDGKLVANLVNETRGAGLHEVIWNGQNDAGQVQASGLYFYRIEAGPYSQVRKMTLMK